MMRTFCLAVLISLFGLSTLSQAQTVNNLQAPIKPAIFLELGGPSLLGINYDMRFNRDTRLGFKAGLGGIYLREADEGYLAASFQVNYLFGNSGKYLEVGLGPALWINRGGGDGSSESLFNGSLSIGYRYQPVKGGYHFRVGLAPLFGSVGIIPYPYVSFGYCW